MGRKLLPAQQNLFLQQQKVKKTEIKRRLKILGWSVFLLGVPPWVIILISKHNYIIAAVESGGIPSMILGLYTVYYPDKPLNKELDRFASISMYIFIVIGVSYSLFEYGGLTAFSQLLEMGTIIGFFWLVATCLLKTSLMAGYSLC